MRDFGMMFGAWVLTFGAFLAMVWSRGRALRENRALKRVVRSRFVVYRNPDGGNGPLGERIVDDTFESLYLLAQYGGMEATVDHEFAISTAYGTMTIAVDMPREKEE